MNNTKVDNPPLGPSINYVGRRGEFAKCLCYYISLFSKVAFGGGGGQKLVKSCLRSLWMVPNAIFVAFFGHNCHFLKKISMIFREIWLQN